MNEVQSYPDYFEKFLVDYSFYDTEEVYTNGSMLIPVFRVLQGVDFYHDKKLKEYEQENKHIKNMLVHMYAVMQKMVWKIHTKDLAKQDLNELEYAYQLLSELGLEYDVELEIDKITKKMKK